MNFITQLFLKLHAIYGKNTRICHSENGGFDLKDRTTSELVMEFNNFKLKNVGYEFSDICDLVLNQHQMVAVAFTAVCSNIFKDEINRVYQNAEMNMIQQQQDEI